MRRHFLALFLALAMVLTLTACGGSDSADGKADLETEATEEPVAEADAGETGDDPDQDPAGEQPAEEAPAASAWAPTMPITMIVNNEANQGTDATARLLCQYAEKYIGQSVYFENMVGESGTQGWEELAHREADGMTLGVVESPRFNQFLRDRKPDFTLRRYKPVCAYVSDVAAIVVRANDSRFNSVDDIVAFGQAHPNELLAATNGDRGSMHIATQAFAKSALFLYSPVHYPTASEAVLAVRGGSADFCVAEVDEFLGREDDLQILAVMSPTRIGAYPDVPTLGELGYTDQWFGSATCIVAPAGTSDDVISFYDAAFKSALEDPAFVSAASGTLSTEYRNARDAGTLIRMQQQFLESMTEDFWTIVLPEPEPAEEIPAEG